MADLDREMRFLLNEIFDYVCAKNECRMDLMSFENQTNELANGFLQGENKGCKISNENYIKTLYENIANFQESNLIDFDFVTTFKICHTRTSGLSIEIEHLEGKSLEKTQNEISWKNEKATETLKDAFVQTVHPVVTADKHCQCDLLQAKDSTDIKRDDLDRKKIKLNNEEVETKYTNGHISVLLKPNPRIRVGLSKRFKPPPLHNALLF